MLQHSNAGANTVLVGLSAEPVRANLLHVVEHFHWLKHFIDRRVAHLYALAEFFGQYSPISGHP
jgi:hypothetical protein